MLKSEELWKLRKKYQMLDDTHTADKIMHGIFQAKQALKEQPTVDAVPVVRCRDCKWFDGQECCDRNGLFVGFNYETFYCADGERRTKSNET